MPSVGTWSDGRSNRLALTPTPGCPDEDGCWSGCAVVHNGNVYVLYTGLQGKRQRPCLAVAQDDGLLSFRKFERNPVISEEPLDGLVGFRDHTVRCVDGEFRQLIGSGSDTLGGCVLQYRSRYLISWEYCGVFLSAKPHGLPGRMWECPDLFLLEDRWFLVLSVMPGDAGTGVHFVEGTIENDLTFTPSAGGRLDLGSRWYSPQSFDAPGARRIAFGWLREREEGASPGSARTNPA